MKKYLNNYSPSKYLVRKNCGFLFSGFINKRESANFLIEVFAKVASENVQFTLIGKIDSTFNKKYCEMLKNKKIQLLSSITRDKLATLMLENDVFIFQTLAERSARVIFKAIAAGMPIITTPQADSVVKNMAHGIIIEPGNEEKLKDALYFFINNTNKIKEFGESSRITIKENYNSTVYKKKIIKLYNSVLNTE
ncbi:MAG: glycosyltransferase [Elusimicrobiota bacterium]